MNKFDGSESPFFSIITCTLNSGKYLRENIASVESQSYQNFEHIFIDAFSNDETIKIIEDYKKRLPNNVRFYQSPPKGISNAMNEGIDLARGKVILHLHSDDRLDSDAVLSWIAEIFEKRDPSIVIGNCRLMGLDSEKFTWAGGWLKRFLARVFLKPLLFYTNLVPHPSTYVSKKVFERNGKFQEKYRVVMDYDFWFRVFRKEKVVITDRVLSSYRFHGDTISTTQKALGLKEIEEIRRIYRNDYKLSYGIFKFLLYPFLGVRRCLRTYL
jgi:glycosyltransferase involved in cell wall biosynthesis